MEIASAHKDVSMYHLRCVLQRFARCAAARVPPFDFLARSHISKFRGRVFPGVNLSAESAKVPVLVLEPEEKRKGTMDHTKSVIREKFRKEKRHTHTTTRHR